MTCASQGATIKTITINDFRTLLRENIAHLMDIAPMQQDGPYIKT